MIIKVAASGYILHLIFGAIGPLGLHDAGYTLELQLNPQWLVLEILVRDGPGAENIYQLQFGMELVALPAQGDHAAPLPILNRCLTHFLELCDGFRG